MTEEEEVRQEIEQAAREGAAELSFVVRGLTALPPEIGQLTQLQSLNLDNNQLTALPPEIGQISQLQSLNLDHNKLTDLAPWIGQLTQLQKLYLHGNQLTALPPEIGQLSQLRLLSLGNNQLTALPAEISQLSQLRQLYLHNNQLTGLPPEIGQLSRLQALFLGGNQLTALPAEIAQLTQLDEGLYLHDNAALGMPPEILGPTWQETKPRGNAEPAKPADIFAYYFRSQRETTRPLNEAKILLVGQGGVGKTSLVKRLVENKFDPEESKTEGINITQWKAPGKGERGAGDVRLNVWDFGGQEIMHATHQFFLTKRSLYLLVLDARKGEGESNIHYWLRIIQSYGGDSPVLVVINKNEPPDHLELNETRLAKDYGPNVKGFFKTSCSIGSGIPELRAAIEEQIQQLPHVYDQVPASYFAVKQELETKADDEDFIEIGEYRKLCRRHGVEETNEQRRLIRFLHDLGNVLNFDDPDSPYRLEQTKVLNPEWVTGGVYKILNNVELMKRGGVLKIGQLGGILDDSQRYPSQHRQFIVDMMRQFELCFTFPGSEGQRVLIPELLQPNEPELNWDEQDALNFQYHYTVLPGGILPRFIVRTHEKLTKKRPTYWQSGVVLEIEGCRALVRGDTQAGRVFISIQGPVPARRRAALAVIRDQFRQIHATIPKIGAEEKVPLPDAPRVAVGYEHLLTLEEQRIESFVPEGTKTAYAVQELLNGIEEKGRRAGKGREVGDSGGDGIDPKPKPDSDRSKATERPRLDLETFRTVVRYLLGAVVVIIGVIAGVYKWVPDTPQVIMLAGIALVVVVLVFAAAFTGIFGEKTAARMIELVLNLFKNRRSGDEDGADAAD